MVQQLSLVSTIGKPEFSLVVNTLIALTGQKPKILANENILFKPIINLKYVQNQQQINNSIHLNLVEQSLIRVRTKWHITGANHKGDSTEPQQRKQKIKQKKEKNQNLVVNDILANDNAAFMKQIESLQINLPAASSTILNNNNSNAPEVPQTEEFSFQISDIPAAGKRKVSSQTIYEVNICQSRSQLYGYLKELGYIEHQRYAVKGLSFIYNGTINIEIFQIFAIQEEKSASNDGDGKNREETNTNVKLRIVDELENWFLKIYSNVAKITDIGLINKATADLVAVQKELSDLIMLKIPERNCMDSRIDDNI